MSAQHVAWTARRARVTAGLMLALFVGALDATIVATAVPTIAGELGQFPLYPWLIAGYLLTSTTTIPLWGRLADIHGRRRALLAGLAWFVGASMLCAGAPGMGWLVAFRALQGIGAGCLQPVALTAVGDLFPLAQRARLQGVFSSVWAVAALAGPALGALFVSTIGWRWLFWVNLPAGLVAAGLLLAHRDRPPGRGRERLDYAGATALTAGLALLLVGVGAGSGSPRWPLAALGAASLAAFVVIERRTARPILPLSMLRHPVIGPATAAAFCAGTLMFGLNAYLPLYVQGVLLGTAYQAGATLSLASLGWTATAIVSGRLLLRFGYRPLVALGALAMVAGTAAFLVRPAGAGLAWLGAAAFVIGMGMGTLQTPLLIVVQSAVGWSSRGAATALNQLSRTIGGAVGVSLMGVLLAARARADAAARGVDPATVAGALGRGGHVDRASAPLVAEGLHAIFVVLFGIALVTAVIGAGILFRPRGEPAGTGG